jgi:hypothetical protein
MKENITERGHISSWHLNVFVGVFTKDDPIISLSRLLSTVCQKPSCNLQTTFYKMNHDF